MGVMSRADWPQLDIARSAQTLLLRPRLAHTASLRPMGRHDRAVTADSGYGPQVASNPRWYRDPEPGGG